jgi:hypothetical protein
MVPRHCHGMDLWLILPALRGYLCGDLQSYFEDRAQISTTGPRRNSCILAHLEACRNRVSFSRNSFLLYPCRCSFPLKLCPSDGALPDPRYRVLAIAGHPVPYMAPLLRHMAEHPNLIVRSRIARCAEPNRPTTRNSTLRSNGTFHFSTDIPGNRCATKV